MSKAVITIALWLIVSAAQWVAADKLRLGVAPFEVGGQINREAGNELAAFVVGILGDRYRIKERLQLPTLVKEALVQSPSEMAKADQELRQNLQVDLLFLGRVTRTAGDYTLLVRMCDLRGDLSFRDTISASSWEALKEKLRLSLIRHKLAPLDAVESKAPVTFVFIDAHGRRHPARLHLEGKNHSYRIDGPTPVVPGRYRFRPLDQSWQPENTWIEIKPGAQAETIEIRVKARGIDIYVVFGYGGIGAALLGIALFLLRHHRQKALTRLTASSASQPERVEDVIALAGIGQKACKGLAQDLPEFADRLITLAGKLGVVADKIEMMPQDRLREKRYYLEQTLHEINNELAVLEGLARGGNHAAVAGQIAAIEKKAEVKL